jgi:hypothetical protein
VTIARNVQQKLTLRIEGQRITADRFLKAISSFVALINDVSETVTQERSAFRWLITVESGSAVVHFRPEPNKANPSLVMPSLKAINDGIKTIQKRPERPRYWSDNALRKVKELSEVLDVATGAIDHVSVKGDHAAIDITRKTSAHVDELIGSEYKSLGTIEGRLRTVTEAGGIHFVIQDAATHNNVRCFFDEERADEYIAAWRKRVGVYGEIRYRKDGVPVSISVQKFRVLRESHELPSIKEMRGILAS